MNKFKYSRDEQQINSVLKHQEQMLTEISFPSADECGIANTKLEAMLRRLGYAPKSLKGQPPVPKMKKIMTVPTWEELCEEAERHVGTDCALESIFTEEELHDNGLAIRQLRGEFDAIHRLDAMDVVLSAFAGIVGAAVDILLVGIPKKSANGLKAGPLADYIRDYFDKRFPESEMEKLANSKVSKVPFDAQDNRNTTVWVEGLSAYYHRLLQLGHDPILGFVFGVADILSGG